jgi:hypothetical protein
MKILSICLSLAISLCAPALHAESKLYGDPDPGTPFIDKATLEKHGAMSRMVVLYSYKRMKSGTVYRSGKNDTYYYKSTKVLFEFDCEKHRSRILQTVFFSDHEGKGNLVHDQPSAGEWIQEPVRQNAVNAISVACSLSKKSP